MQKYFIFYLIFFLQSCNSLDGGLHNFKSYSLIDSFGDRISLDEGVIPVTLELKSSRLFSIKHLGHSFNFTIPKGESLPEEEGEIRLKSFEVGQDYGVFAKISSSVLQGDLIRDQESCSWIERYRTCDTSNVCSTEYRSLYGIKDVSYRNNIHQKIIILNLNIDETGEVISQLVGEKKFIKKVYRYESICY